MIKYSFKSFLMQFLGLFIALLVLQSLSHYILNVGYAFYDIRAYIIAIFIAFLVALVIDAIYCRNFNKFILIFVFSFLYIPMIVLIIYSFNNSKAVGVWGGFSFRWYQSLVSNSELLLAVSYSLFIGMIAATGAVVLGTLASFVLVRYSKFKGSNLFSFISSAPLVMPDVITGLALLLLFATMTNLFGWPEKRGLLTICIAHITFCTAYVIVVVSARLRELDRDIEEAAMDLGANPIKVFFIITLPMILPSLVSGWLLAFTLSLDDYVISNFVRGDIQTLPIVVWGYIKFINPDVNALASVIVFIVGILGFISWILMRKAEKRKMKDMRMVS